jgi:hypothetical protein
VTSVPFKETILNSTYRYIGLDSSRSLYPSGPTNKEDSYGQEVVLSNDIMSESLLSSDFDILFYNTKIDTISNTATKIKHFSR